MSEPERKELKSLIDDLPLKEGPLSSAFLQLNESSLGAARATRRTAQKGPTDFTDLVKKVRNDPEAEWVALVWLKHALPAEKEYTDREFAVYVQFYWELFKEGKRFSLDVLKTARKNLNYDNVPSSVGDLEEPFSNMDEGTLETNREKGKPSKQYNSKKGRAKAVQPTPTPDTSSTHRSRKRTKSIDSTPVLTSPGDETPGSSYSAPPLRTYSRSRKGSVSKSKRARVSEDVIEEDEGIHSANVLTTTTTQTRIRKPRRSMKKLNNESLSESPQPTGKSASAKSPESPEHDISGDIKLEPLGEGSNNATKGRLDGSIAKDPPSRRRTKPPLSTRTDKGSDTPVIQDTPISAPTTQEPAVIPFESISHPETRPPRSSRSSYQKGKRTPPKDNPESKPKKKSTPVAHEEDVTMAPVASEVVANSDAEAWDEEDERPSRSNVKKLKKAVPPPPRKSKLDSSPNETGPPPEENLRSPKRRRLHDEDESVARSTQPVLARRGTIVRPPRRESFREEEESTQYSEMAGSPSHSVPAEERVRKKPRHTPSAEATADLSALMNSAFGQNQALNQSVNEDESGLLGQRRDTGDRPQTKHISPPRLSTLMQQRPFEDGSQEMPVSPGRTSPNRLLPPIGSPPLNHYLPPNRPRPPMWSASRQELCESLPAFRSYQGGVYHSKGIVKGYLLSGFGASRDAFLHGGKLIISHGGGKSENVTKRRQQLTVKSATDQKSDDASVRCLYQTYMQRLPLVLLADDKYPHLPQDVSQDMKERGIGYIVLGHYRIQHVWSEPEERLDSVTKETITVVRFKFAFQWCESQGEPWWYPEPPIDSNASPSSGTGNPGPSRKNEDSTRSRKPSKKDKSKPTKVQNFAENQLRPPRPEHIYRKCDHCREESPHVYETGWVCTKSDCTHFWKLPSGELLTRDRDLAYNPRFTALLPPDGPSGPEFPAIHAPRLDGTGTSMPCTRGFHCQACGRLSSRFKWQNWECANSDCQTVYKVEFRIRHARELRLPVKIPKEYFLPPKSEVISEGQRTFDMKGYKLVCQSFIFPRGGKAHQIRFMSYSQETEPDAIFKEYQEQARDGLIPFQRWPLKQHKLKGALLTNYFSQNCGEPYQYVGAAEHTIPFDRAPSAVINARSFLMRSIKQAVGLDVPFNEVLTAAYMDEQSMAYHSDDEKGLGPFVAGLSLGSPALMHFRFKAKYLPEDAKRSPMVTFSLRHGDILAMDGEEMQEFYEHTVDPTGFRIAATARVINNSSPA